MRTWKYRWENTCHANYNQKEAGIALLRSDNKFFKAANITRDKGDIYDSKIFNSTGYKT